MTSPSPEPSPDHVVKLIPADQWPALCASTMLAYSALDQADGFMHLSTPDQMLDTANRHYTDYSHVAGLLIPTQHLPGTLKWEPAAKRNNALFPHLYGPCRTAWIEKAIVLARGSDARFAVTGEIEPPFDPDTDFSAFSHG
ncbi:MAG: DUF952 domain-containing protein [Pseudomonadota bacterium]